MHIRVAANTGGMKCIVTNVHDVWLWGHSQQAKIATIIYAHFSAN